MTRSSRLVLAAGALALALAPAAVTAAPRLADAPAGSVPRAQCGPGSLPETGLQGQVPRADRDSGRSRQGYRCNLTLIGQYQGDGATWVEPSYGHCSYLGTFAPGAALQAARGVHVVDVSDERHPRHSDTLDSAAMLLGTWESLKVTPARGLLAATGVPIPPGTGALSFDVYDVKSDCAHPRLLNRLAGPITLSLSGFGHEGQWSPDGKIYYAMSAGGGAVQAIDVTNAALPRLMGGGIIGATNHGVSISPDGRTMYGVTMVPAGIQVLDISEFQDRKLLPQIRPIGAVSWSDGLLSQHTLNFVSGGRPFLYAVDEGDGGGVRLIDIADPTKPKVVRQYRLEINRPENAAQRTADTSGDGVFGYNAHYCNLDRQVDPTMLACGYFQSGVRLFDIRDPLRPRELAYYNPPAQVGREAGTPNALSNSAHAWAVYAPDLLDPSSFGGQTLTGALDSGMTADWCTSPPYFRPNNTIWVTCQDNGFQVLKYTPYRRTGTTPSPTPSPSPTQTSAPTAATAPSAAPHHHASQLPTNVDAGQPGGSPWHRAWPWLALAAGSLLALLAAARRALA